MLETERPVSPLHRSLLSQEVAAFIKQEIVARAPKGGDRAAIRSLFEKHVYDQMPAMMDILAAAKK